MRTANMNNSYLNQSITKKEFVCVCEEIESFLDSKTEELEPLAIATMTTAIGLHGLFEILDPRLAKKTIQKLIKDAQK